MTDTPQKPGATPSAAFADWFGRALPPRTLDDFVAAGARAERHRPEPTAAELVAQVSADAARPPVVDPSTNGAKFADWFGRVYPQPRDLTDTFAGTDLADLTPTSTPPTVREMTTAEVSARLGAGDLPTAAELTAQFKTYLNTH